MPSHPYLFSIVRLETELCSDSGQWAEASPWICAAGQERAPSIAWHSNWAFGLSELFETSRASFSLLICFWMICCFFVEWVCRKSANQESLADWRTLPTCWNYSPSKQSLLIDSCSICSSGLLGFTWCCFLDWLGHISSFFAISP